MTEYVPLPEIALSAFRLLDASFQRSAHDLGTQTMKLKPDGDGWAVNFNTGQFERSLPDAPADAPSP